MLRRSIIILAAAMAALALATVPAGAGAGSMELYSAPNFGGTHVSVPETTVDDYLNSCVSTYTLTSTVLTTAQSTQNYTAFDLRLYTATGCSLSTYITTVSPNSTWSSSSQSAAAVYVLQTQS
jgi:hypothetical protein